MNHIRRSCKALKYGTIKFRHHQDGLVVFSRIDSLAPQDQKEMVVVLNNTSSSIALPTGVTVADERSGIEYRNLLNGHEKAWTDNKGKLNFQEGLSVPGNSVMVFASLAQTEDYNAYLGGHLCKGELD